MEGDEAGHVGPERRGSAVNGAIATNSVMVGMPAGRERAWRIGLIGRPPAPTKSRRIGKSVPRLNGVLEGLSRPPSPDELW